MSITGKKIKEARIELLGLTQAELAGRLDIDPVNVSRWERGVTEPRIRHVRAVAEMANVPVAWFFEEFGRLRDLLEVEAEPT